MTSTPQTIDAKLAKPLLPTRESGAHKWGIGGVLVIAGAPQFTGAAWLAARAAGRAGAGIVRLASGRSVIGAIAGSIPEVAHVILPESDSTSGARRTLELIGESLDRVRSVVIGPGLGDDEASSALLSTVFGFGRSVPRTRDNIGFGGRARPLSASGEATAEPEQPTAPLFGDGSLPVVIDADALNWLAKQPDWWEQLPAHKAILTPHIGELSRLLDIEPDELLKDPQARAEEAAAKWKQTVLLKTSAPMVTDGKTTRIAGEEPVALATAGTGDVLAGTVGALLAQGLAPLDAASLAIYLGSRAAATLAEEFGELGVIAPDVPDAIARAARELAR